MPRSPLTPAKPQIVQVFKNLDHRVLTLADIDAILRDNRESWRLPQTVTRTTFLDYLTQRTPLQELRFDLPFRPTVRYTWGDVPTLEIVQSLRPTGYFSHFTAMYLNQLTEQLPKTIYLNDEQKLSGGGGELTQPGIDRAFRAKCRISSNTTVFRDQTICIINGGNTGQLGVIEMIPDDSRPIRTTNIERTLIDATVRPPYAGGVFEVAKAYEVARGRLSVNKLVAMLRKLNFTYPYHQAIGFYLERAGYKTSQVDMLRSFDIAYDFYLTYAMKDTEHIPHWRLYVPKGF